MTLEDDVETEVEKIPYRHRYSDNQLFKYCIDTASQLSYSWSVMLAYEQVIIGLDFDESIRSRIGATVVNILTSRPYAAYRDYVFRKAGVDEDSSGVKKYFTDLFAFNTFCIPFYTGILYASGAEPEEIALGAATLPLMSTFMGRTLGMWIDQVRKWTGIPTATEREEASNQENDK